jgi:kynurenine formamidase
VERDVTLIGSDNGAVGPLGPGGRFTGTVDDDVHLLTLWRHGVYLAEMLWLEELAATGRAEFLFVAAPLAIEGGTGSPLTPVAVV